MIRMYMYAKNTVVVTFYGIAPAFALLALRSSYSRVVPTNSSSLASAATKLE
jgi:hypothetical protein